MNKYIIDNYKEWRKDYLGSITGSLEESKFVFYNKEHFKRYYKRLFDNIFYNVHIELGKIKTYTDAILYKNSEFPRIREICKYIIKGDLEIYEEKE